MARRSFGLLVVLLSIVALDLSIEAPPSVLPQRRYCDITGLEVRETSESQFNVFMMKLVQAPYTDPITGLRFNDKSIYELIKSLVSSRAAITALLAADRGCMTTVCQRCKGLPFRPRREPNREVTADIAINYLGVHRTSCKYNSFSYPCEEG